MLHSIDFSQIFPFIPYLLLSTFLKCIALLLITALIQPCLHKLPSNSKHQFWFALLVIVAVMPVFSLVVPAGFLPFKIQSGASSRALRVLIAVLPQYNELGGQMHSASGMTASTSVRLSQGGVFTWEAVIVMLWLTGIIYFLARVVIGKFGIMRMWNDARVIENSGIRKTLKSVSCESGIHRNIQVLTSPSCRVPFTYGTFKPIILLPPGAASWPVERLRSVLIHELAHVKRLDSLTQQFARIVCAIFWFIPTVWIAYSHLHIEQEKSCDECAVDRGIEAAQYARHILDVVRFARGHVFLTGIYFSRGKRKMLEKRILHLLKPGALKFISRRRVFVATVALCFFLMFPILVLNPMFAEDTKNRISRKEFWNALSGTWVNIDYLGTWEFYEQKLIVYPDGKFEYFPFTTDTEPSRQAQFSLTEAWIDSDGFMWHRGIYKGPLTFYVLGKISDSGNTWEVIVDGVNDPTEWDTSKTKYEEYEVRYRQ